MSAVRRFAPFTGRPLPFGPRAVMNTSGVDPLMLHAWLAGRSLARGVPQPVADRGGFRVDTNTDVEVSRWIFPHPGPGLVELGRAIRAPRHLLKLCGEADELRAALPAGWQLHAPSYFMQSSGNRIEHPLPDGYRIEVDRAGAVVEVRIWSDDGMPAARGHGGETPEAFVYDRIVTAPEHRRKGLGRVVMAALHAARQHAGRELLVATEEGRALYANLGWRTISPYCTASIAAS